jgi:quinolinate synthase
MASSALAFIQQHTPDRRELIDAIDRLRREKNAVILAHYYQEPDIQDIADFMGDSLALSQAAARTQADVIVFCGVHFMAETAKILNPSKPVLLPDLDAGCSLADGCPVEEFAPFVASHPDHKVVSYINCSAAVKALSDVICTSSNAVKMVNHYPKDQPLIFAPDKHLGRYVAKQTGRELLLWNGACQVHELFSEKKLVQLKIQHPAAKVIAHPECEDAVLGHAEFIGSTNALLNFTQIDVANEYIVCTEPGIIHQMKKARPEKTYIAAPPDSGCACNECPHMRLNTLQKVYECLHSGGPEVTLPADIIAQARVPLQRMLDWSA